MIGMAEINGDQVVFSWYSVAGDSVGDQLVIRKWEYRECTFVK
jgi:hypothetical protein